MSLCRAHRGIRQRSLAEDLIVAGRDGGDRSLAGCVPLRAHARAEHSLPGGIHHGIVIEPFNVEDHQALLTRTRDLLGEMAFAAAWAQGEGLTVEQAIAEADAVLANAAQGDSAAGQHQE